MAYCPQRFRRGGKGSSKSQPQRLPPWHLSYLEGENVHTACLFLSKCHFSWKWYVKGSLSLSPLLTSAWEDVPKVTRFCHVYHHRGTWRPWSPKGPSWWCCHSVQFSRIPPLLQPAMAPTTGWLLFPKLTLISLGTELLPRWNVFLILWPGLSPFSIDVCLSRSSPLPR